MRILFYILIISVTFSSCFWRNQYRVEQFHYTRGGENLSVPVVIPKGYHKKWTSRDEAGNTILTYSWKKGPVLYMAYMEDTSASMQPIFLPENLPRISHHTGALIYKGIDEDLLFYREVRQKKFRMGYRWVDSQQEYRFDSATNYLVVWPLIPE